MSTPKAARRNILKASGFVDRAHVCALCANVIVMSALFFCARGQCLRM